MICPGGHHADMYGWSGSVTMMRLKPCVVAGPWRSKNCSSLSASRSNASEPDSPFISTRSAFLRPVAKRVASYVANAPPANRAMKTTASSTVTVPRPLAPVACSPPPALSAGNGRSLINVSVSAHPQPQRKLGIADPVLQIHGAHVADRPEPALSDHLPRERDRRNAPIVETNHRSNAAFGGVFRFEGHRLGFGQRVRERLFAQHVLARAQRGDG